MQTSTMRTAPPRLRFYLTVWVLLIWALAPSATEVTQWLEASDGWLRRAVVQLELQDMPPLRALMTLTPEQAASIEPEPAAPPRPVAGP